MCGAGRRIEASVRAAPVVTRWQGAPHVEEVGGCARSHQLWEVECHLRGSVCGAEASHSCSASRRSGCAGAGKHREVDGRICRWDGVDKPDGCACAVQGSGQARGRRGTVPGIGSAADEAGRRHHRCCTAGSRTAAGTDCHAEHWWEHIACPGAENFSIAVGGHCTIQQRRRQQQQETGVSSGMNTRHTNSATHLACSICRQIQHSTRACLKPQPQSHYSKLSV